MWLFRSSEPDFTTTTKGIDRQRVCRGCSRIEILLDRSRRDKAAPPGRLPFHKDYTELEKCAKNCDTCCIFRQALLLKCATASEAEELSTNTKGCPLYARVRAPAASSELQEPFQINIEIRDFPEQSARVRCCPDMQDNLNLPQNPNSPHILRRAQQWVTNCHDTHHQTCSSLSWSSENPTRLVRILSESELQLCQPGSEPVQYVALSYSWGTQLLSREESDQIERGKTTPSNVTSRYNSFPVACLPSTLRDAISFCHGIGILYAWIDSLCIIQDDKTDFAREAPKMHQYYGNAHFTLAVSSNLKATDPLLAPRTAFSYPIRSSSLGGLWTSIPDLSMKEMLFLSPLTKRAWTLQEQCLSPRILYWTPNRMYWSCAHTQLIESIDPGGGSIGSTDLNGNAMQANSPQAYLLQCNRGTSESRHKEWLSVIESYTLRDMSNPLDRFAALSALASKYNSSFSTNQGYIAGLWKSSFAEDLSWTTIRPVPTDPTIRPNDAPSWAWASLPIRTGIRMAQHFNPSQNFKLVRVGVPETEPGFLDNEDSILRGALVKYVCVRARLRPFWPSTARYQPWSAILLTVKQEKSIHVPLTQVFSFSRTPEQSVFSADFASGKVVAYEARKQEVVGQLDYMAYSARVCDQSLKIFAMEIAESVVLLLELLENGAFRRVGAVTCYRPDFFDGVGDMEVILE